MPYMPAISVAMADPVAQALMQAPEPFMWGQGGAKLSPQQVAQLRAQGEGMSQADFSPVAHWTQGLGRALTGLEGGLKMKRAEKMEGENREYQQRMSEALASGDVNDEMIARVLMDPNASQGAQAYAGALMQSRQPKQAAPTEVEKLMLAAGIQPGSPEWNEQISAELTNRRDPYTTFVGGNMGYTGRQSGLAAALGGGGQVSGAQPTTAPPAGAIDMLRKDPSLAKDFDQKYGAGASAQVLGKGGGGGGVTSTFLEGL